ncbi:hypothetical protein Mal52_30310 [Symmachiella dynata]|uniref:Uncharacterized protein n=1 Tax=Symmachiella dynata TaxID=2527995 RepID=A0A517ZQ28_9PLAN|nr:hypothetical protein [Symmachiella dynata]QDU44547.1 hypothetical protein Mal52_30310 [Symmachiella dynata]
MVESPGKVRKVRSQTIVVALLVLCLSAIAVVFVVFGGLFRAKSPKADSGAAGVSRGPDAVIKIAWRLPGTMAWGKTLPIGELPEGSQSYSEDKKEMFKLSWKYIRTAPGAGTCKYVIKYWNGSEYITHKTVSVKDGTSAVLLDEPAIKVRVLHQGGDVETKK